MQEESDRRPRVGVPWRTAAEEKVRRRRAYDHYLNAIRDASGEPVEVSLLLPPQQLARLAESLDAIVLSGSGADVDPRRYGRLSHPKAAAPDKNRERTDDFLLEHAFAAGKPVLAICYGAQLLNVYLGGSLLQDIPSERKLKVNHDPGAYGFHTARIESGQAGGHLADLARQVNGGSPVRVNSSHHQAILRPGCGLRVTARAPDGVIEAVEWSGREPWVVGVQWHPERMRGDTFADALFRRLVAAARTRLHRPG